MIDTLGSSLFLSLSSSSSISLGKARRPAKTYIAVKILRESWQRGHSRSMLESILTPSSNRERVSSKTISTIWCFSKNTSTKSAARTTSSQLDSSTNSTSSTIITANNYLGPNHWKIGLRMNWTLWLSSSWMRGLRLRKNSLKDSSISMINRLMSVLKLLASSYLSKRKSRKKYIYSRIFLDRAESMISKQQRKRKVTLSTLELREWLRTQVVWKSLTIWPFPNKFHWSTWAKLIKLSIWPLLKRISPKTKSNISRMEWLQDCLPSHTKEWQEICMPILRKSILLKHRKT